VASAMWGITALKLINSLYLQGKEGNGKMHSRDRHIMCKNSFTLRNVQNPLTLMSFFATMNNLLLCWVS
jgi:hypothetical protein